MTRRQIELVGLLERGLTNKEIATDLGISEAGVKAHVSRLLLRYSVSNRVALLSVVRHRPTSSDGSGYQSIAADLEDKSLEGISDRDGADGDGFAGVRKIDVRARGQFSDGEAQLLAGSQSADMPRIVGELRGALAGLDLAFELAERLPPEAMRGPLLEVLHARVQIALSAAEALDVQIRRDGRDGSSPASRRRRA